jgi:hypothetical protein
MSARMRCFQFTQQRRPLRRSLVFGFLAAAGCGGPDDPGAQGKAVDSGTDVGGPSDSGGSADRAEDAVQDRSLDVAVDAGQHDGAETGNDTGGALDVSRPDGMDGGARDNGTIDVMPDAFNESRVDVAPDADASLDSNGDAAIPDASTDPITDARGDSDGGALRKPSGVFGGGPFYGNADTVMPRMRASGFTTMILWSIHVYSNGDLVLNDVPLFSNGSYVGSDAAWPSKVASLKTAPTSVTRIEFSVGAGGTTDFESIESLIASQGTGPASILYKNFAALKAAIPATDAVDFDDESNYDVASTVAFSIMLGDLGYKITLCPYTNSTFWTSVFNQTNTQRPGLVDRVLLQVYAGGASNNPVTWSGYFGGLQVEPGLWSRHATNCATGDTPASVRTKMTNWRNSVGGGWMWLLDDMLACDGQYPLESYATAINEALNP